MTLTQVYVCVCVRAFRARYMYTKILKHLIAAGQVDYRFISVLFVIIGTQVYSSFNDNRQVEIK